MLHNLISCLLQVKFVDEQGQAKRPKDIKTHEAAICSLPQHLRVAARQLKHWLPMQLDPNDSLNELLEDGYSDYDDDDSDEYGDADSTY